jgi:hypothetical protein
MNFCLNPGMVRAILGCDTAARTGRKRFADVLERENAIGLTDGTGSHLAGMAESRFVGAQPAPIVP